MPSQFVDPDTLDAQDKEIEDFFEVLRVAGAAAKQAAKDEPKRYPVVEPEPLLDEELNIHEPWEQIKGEPDDAYEAFFFFRALWPGMRTEKTAYIQMMRAYDPKSMETQEARHFKVPIQWRRWRKKYRWNDRVQAWDVHRRQALIDAERDQEDLREMVERHMTSLRMLQRRGIQHIDEYGFGSGQAALRAVHHSMVLEEKLAGIPDVTHLVTMDGEQLIGRYQSLMATLAGIEEGNGAPNEAEDRQIPGTLSEEAGGPARSLGSGGQGSQEGQAD